MAESGFVGAASFAGFAGFVLIIVAAMLLGTSSVELKVFAEPYAAQGKIGATKCELKKKVFLPTLFCDMDWEEGQEFDNATCSSFCLAGTEIPKDTSDDDENYLPGAKFVAWSLTKENEDRKYECRDIDSFTVSDVDIFCTYLKDVQGSVTLLRKKSVLHDLVYAKLLKTQQNGYIVLGVAGVLLISSAVLAYLAFH